MRLFRYKAYGLNIESEFELSELLRGDGAPSVTIRRGYVPASLNGSSAGHDVCQVRPGRYLLRLEGRAHFLVSSGREIRVDQVSGQLSDEARLYLLGRCFGVLLHQRNVLALHASAILSKRGAVLFSGQSGSGKSTILRAFLKRGYQMLADDITGITEDSEGRPIALPAYPRIMLGRAAAAELDVPVGHLRPMPPYVDKFAISPNGQFTYESMPVQKIFALATANVPAIELQPLTPVEAFFALTEHTFQNCVLNGLGKRTNHFRLTTRAANLNVTRATRPVKSTRVNSLVEEIERMII